MVAALPPARSPLGRGLLTGLPALVPLLVLLVVLAPSVTAGAAPARVTASYGSTTVPGVRVPMSDGTTLVGDVMYPADRLTGERAAGTFPVLLSQNPYACDTPAGNLHGLGQGALGDPAYFVERGYVYASVCVRGTGRSGGAFDLFGPRERRDGVELVAWAAGLDGSDGTVGLTGCSYLGINQLLTASLLPRGSAVKAMLPACAGAETYREAMNSGGMPTQTRNYFTHLGSQMGPRAGAYGTALAAAVQRGGDRAYAGAWARSRTPGDLAAAIVRADIPALLWSGNLDLYAQGSQEMYTYLQNAYFHRPVHASPAPGQRTTPRYQAVVGPWGHGEGVDRAVALAWFDTWLKGRRTAIGATTTPLHLYQQGSRTWLHTTAFQRVRSYTPYYLGPGGTLGPTPPRSPGADRITYTEPSRAEGRLTYTTEPFRRGAVLAGPLSARVSASSSGTNLTLIARLDDIAPGGAATSITSGSLVASLRALDPNRSWRDAKGVVVRPYGTFGADRYLRPGRVYDLTIGLSPRAVRIAPGHALRLTLTTRTPEADCSAPLGVDPCFPTDPQRRTLPGTYTVHRSPTALSAVNLPLAGDRP
ncbi:CocE/NonD family hydrolase [Streptomyces liangshanensis]|uniref:CocE/NonD family hydrolase n=1 Tax=Streptomyces liangshanensis TaxID=2717324 RepID=A0A6G9H739_9ACTN|nr:CocE/NonD family hydrolase [Streptomyces liangshanensis]QIQ06264.1 CocE/NonD family hydrolase [Streptomyces liangshanensis]